MTRAGPVAVAKRCLAQAGFCLREAPRAPVAENCANSNKAEFLSGVQPGIVLFCMAAALPMGWALTGRALEPSTPLASYGRQAWGMENGLPQNTVQAL